VSLEAITDDPYPDGSLYLNDQVTASDAVFVDYYCNTRAAARLFTHWLKTNHQALATQKSRDLFSPHHILTLVTLMATTLIALFILPARKQPLRLHISPRIRAKIVPLVGCMVALICILSTLSTLIVKARLWARAATHLQATAGDTPRPTDGPWVAYDFVANIASDDVRTDAPERGYITHGWLALEQDRRPVLRMHTPAAVYYTVHIPPGAWLHAATTLDPAVWSPDRGDGILFIIRAVASGTEETLYYQEIDPKNRPQDRRWHDFDIDLDHYAGQTITLLFITYPVETNDWDWGAWGMPLLLAPAKIEQTTYE
jgi:hypothetical protein